MCVCVCVYVYLSVLYRIPSMIFLQVSCILPGRATTSVNLQRKIFHTKLFVLTKERNDNMQKMEAY